MSILFGVATGAISLIGYGVSDYFAAISSKRMSSFYAALFSRCISAAAVAIIFFTFFTFPQLTINEILLVVVTALFTTIGIAAFYKGFKVGHISVVASIGNAAPIVTVILLLLFMSVQVTALEGACIIAIIVGTILVSFKLEDIKRLNFTKAISGAEYATISMFAWGISLFLGIIIVREIGWVLSGMLTYVFVVIYYSIYAVIKRPKLGKVEKSAAYSVIVVGFTVLIGLLAYNYGVTSQYAIIVAPLSGAAPMLTVVLAFLIMKEKVAINQKLGIAIIIISLVALSIG